MNTAFQQSLVTIAEERSRDHPADAERALRRGMDRYRRRIRLTYGAFIVAALVLTSLLFVAHHVAASAKLTDIAVVSSVSELQPKARAQLSANGIYSDGTRSPLMGSVKWTSRHPAIAKVNASTGEVIGVKPGMATITASLDGITKDARLTVTKAKLEGIKVDGPEKLAQGTAQPFIATGKF